MKQNNVIVGCICAVVIIIGVYVANAKINE